MSNNQIPDFLAVAEKLKQIYQSILPAMV